MPELLRSAHLALSCVWLGCIAAELIGARALPSEGDGARVRLSRLSWRVAACIEVPAFLGVLASGAYLIATPHAAGPGFLVMLTAGVLTLFLTVFKVWVTYMRLSAALRSSWVAHEKLMEVQRLLGVLVVIGVVIAIIAGIIGSSIT